MFVIAFSGFLVACACLFFGRKIALSIGLADKPGGRKHHKDTTPLIGGIVIIPVFVLSLIFAGLSDDYWVLIAAVFLLLGIGVFDDYVPINPFLKFGIEVWIACFVVVFGGVEVTNLGNLFGLGNVELYFISKPFSVMCLVLLMNAMNMIDGVDGLSGGLSTAMLGVLLVVSVIAGVSYNVEVLSLMIAPLMAFLVFNARYPGHAKASVFMGDAGTLALGLIVGWFAIKCAQGADAVIAPSIVPWIVGIMVVDTFAVYLVRAMNGQNPFSADRKHIHHRMIDCGIADGRVTLVLVAFTALTASVAIFMYKAGTPDVVIFGLWLVFFFAHIVFTFRPQGYERLFKCFA